MTINEQLNEKIADLTLDLVRLREEYATATDDLLARRLECNALREENERRLGQVRTAGDFIGWLLSLDDPEDVLGRADRQVVTLTRIIERACEVATALEANVSPRSVVQADNQEDFDSTMVPGLGPLTQFAYGLIDRLGEGDMPWPDDEISDAALEQALELRRAGWGVVHETHGDLPARVRAETVTEIVDWVRDHTANGEWPDAHDIALRFGQEGSRA